MPIADVIDLFLATAGGRPAEPAIVIEGRSWSYAALENRVRQFAGAFARRQCTRVIIALAQGADAYAAMLGAGLAGGFYAPLNVDVPVDKLNRIVRQMQPDVIVADAALASALATAAPRALTLNPNDPANDALNEPLAGSGTRHETAYVIFTSGTTGMPKGVVIPRTALNHFLHWVIDSKTITAQDRVAQFSNIAFDVSVTDIYGALCLGAALYPVIGRADRMFPARLVARERLTVWNSTPSVLSLMMQAGEATQELLGSLRLINTCGEPLLPAHVSTMVAALPDTVMQNSYGPTETTVTMTQLRVDKKNYRAVCGSSVALGCPIDGMAIHLLGGRHPNEGEIVISGPQLASGYWQDPEKTAASFRTIEVAGEPVRAYFSGDWGERRDGHLFFKERIDLQVKIHGFRVELDEIARAIHDQGFPVTCVLKWRDELVAVIEHSQPHTFDEGALRAALGRTLEAHAVPCIIRLIDHLPRTPNDKLDRRAVSAWLETQEAGATAVSETG